MVPPVSPTPTGLRPVVRVRKSLFGNYEGRCFRGKGRMAGATKENIPGGSSTEEQRSQTAFSAKTLRPAGLLSPAGIGSSLTPRRRDAPTPPPRPHPNSPPPPPHNI